MAITPNSYPFSGGAFMGGGGSPVNRDDIHTLNLTKNGESIGNYNPLVGDADVDIPSDAVVIDLSTFSGTMPGTNYSKMASAIGAGQVVMLRSVSGASVVYWTLLAASVLSYKFISVSETAVLTVEIQTSGDSSGNHAFTISNVPLTELRVIDTGASSGDDRGNEHTRIAEALAAGKTVCIKYTSGNNIAYGTLCGAHDGHYTFIVDYGGTPSVLTVIADGSMQISAIFDGDASEFSVTPDESSTGYNITGPTLLKSFLQKFKNLVGALKALAFKDNVSDGDISGTISDNHIESASTWNGKADKANITGATKCKITYNEQGIVTSGADLDASDIPNLPASKITSGTFGTDRIADDAITAAEVKDNETLPVNISGCSNYVCPFIIYKGAQTSNNWAKVATASVSAWNGFTITLSAGFDGYVNAYCYAAEIVVGYQTGSGGAYANLQFYIYRRSYASTNLLDAKLVRSGDTLELWVKDGITDTKLYLVPVYHKGFSTNYADSNDVSKQLTDSAFADYIADKTKYDANVRTTVFIPGIAQVGSPSIPVYVDPDGQVKPCDVLSGGTTNFDRTFTTSYTVGSTDQYITMPIKNGNMDLIADYVTWHNAHFGKLSSPPMIIISVSARDTIVANAGLITLNMYKTGNGCDVFGEKYAYMGNQHASKAYNTQYFTDQTFVSGSTYYLNIRNETSNTMWTAGIILDISIRIVAHAVSVT